MIQIPKQLTGKAKKYWQSHAKRLHDANLLTEADVETFTLLCRIWAMLVACDPTTDSKEAIRFIGLCKQFTSIGKGFGIGSPKDRKASKMEAAPEAADEFGL